MISGVVAYQIAMYIISMRRNPTRSTYVYGNLIVLSHPKQGCVSDEIKQSHAELNIMQGKASHTPQPGQLLLSCRDVSPVYRLFQAVGERWLFTTGLRWSPESEMVPFMWFRPETILCSLDTPKI